MSIHKQSPQAPTPKAGLIRKLSEAIFGAKTPLPHENGIADQHYEPPIIVREVCRNSSYVYIDYQGQRIEAIDPLFGNGTGMRLQPGDEVAIVGYRSQWPLVRKVAKVINFQERIPSRLQMGASP